MKILIANAPFKPNFCRSQRWPVVNKTGALRYPDWAAYATAVLEEEDKYDIKFVDYIANQKGHSGFFEDIKKFKPDLLVIEATTPSLFNDIELASKSKQIGTKFVAFCGTHGSVYPEEVLLQAKGHVDFILRKEYEYTLRQLSQTIDLNRNCKEVLGISYYDNGHIKHNDDRPLIENLDELPYPAWHHLNIKQYFNYTYSYPYLDMISGRGCPQNCTFCQWPQTMMGRRYRYRSPKNVVMEMIYLFENYSINEIFFEDDTLTTNKERLREICHLIIESKIKMNWSCNARCDLDDQDLLFLMKKAGCRMLLVGPESGSQTILDNVKKNLTIKQIEDFIKKAQKAKILVHSCWVMGLPGETEETIRETINFCLKLDTNSIQVSSAMPQVGTELFAWAQKEGHLTAKSWEDYAADGEQIPVIEYPHLSQYTINQAVNNLLKKYYFRPKQIVRLILNAKSFPVLKSYIKGGLMLIIYLLFKSKKIKRTLKKD